MNNIEKRRQDRFWNQLLKIVAMKQVVPIVGEELLILPKHSGKTLYQVLAERYAEVCDLELAPGKALDLSSTIRSHPEFRNNPYDIYQELADEYDDLKPEIPESLLALAKIHHFHLFISTTFDDLLERAINQVRFGGEARTQVIVYSPKSIPSDDEIEQKLMSGSPVIFQIFGNYKTPMKFALTEGDIVEYMHALLSVEFLPKRIFSELYDRPKLMLGNSFPGWLARFFVRLTRKKALDHKESPKQYFADKRVNDDPVLKFFLRKFTINTELIEQMDAVDFTMALAQHWEKTTDLKTPPSQSGPASRPVEKTMPKNAVFISYCLTDQNKLPAKDAQVALALRDALKARGVDVWIDKDRLLGGDDFERKIQRYIKTCSLFVPLISQTTESRSDGFFRKEWRWALDRLPEFTGSGRHFLLPLAIESIDPYEAKVPEEFKKVQFSHMANGIPETSLIDHIQQLHQMAINDSRSARV